MRTKRSLLIALNKAVVGQYETVLKALPIKPKVRETILEGFKDGCREGIKHALQMMDVEIEEDA